MKKIIALSLLVFFTTVYLQAQEEDYGGFAFGVKGGLSLGLQKWNNAERDVLIASHGIAYMESLPVDSKFSLFVQGGYHVRGSAIRSRARVIYVNGTEYETSPRTIRYEFQNIAISLGGKQRFEFGSNSYFYYLLGIRGEYTLGTNLCKYSDLITRENYVSGCSYSAFEEGVQKWNYGMIAGGGVEFELAEKIGILLELTVNPDISYQYRQPARLSNFQNGAGSLQEQLVRNTTLELSVGFRFLRLVEYID